MAAPKMSPEECGKWAVANMLPPSDRGRAEGIARRVAALIKSERAETLGSCWSNPIWFGKWCIFMDSSPFGGWAFCHDDYDGADDSRDGRHGFGNSIEDCKEQIADMEADQ